MGTLSAPQRNARTDGNFRLPRAEAPLEFTGERMTSAVEGQIEFEHYHRYCLARDLCDGRDVLDVASGEGYGAALLAGVARSVIGVEIDGRSVAHAEASYRSAKLRFLQGDALALPLRDASVDVVISFETLEHLPGHDLFIAEVRRVLRPSGLFVVSTPDRAVYSAPGSEPNPYHLLELTDPEFRSLLQAHFAHVRVLAQRPVLGSLLAAQETQEWRSYERRGPDIVEATNGLARAHYLVAIATDGALPGIPSSVYLDRLRVHDVIQEHLRLPVAEAQLAGLVREHEAARIEAARSAEALAVTQNQLRAAEDGRAAAEAQLAGLVREHAAARTEAARSAEALAVTVTQNQLRAAEHGRAAAEAQLAGLVREHEAARTEAARSAETLAVTQNQLRAAEDGRAAAEAQLAGLVREHEAARTEVARSAEALAVTQNQLRAAEDGRAAAEAQLAGLVREREAARTEAARSAEALAVTQNQLRAAEHGRAAAEEEAARSRQLKDAVIYSTSWRLLAPLRAVGRRHPRLARLVRRSVKVIWWTITLQIGRRYVLWRRHRAESSAAVADAETAPPAVVVDAEAPPPTCNLRDAFIAWHGSAAIHFPLVAAPEVSVIIPAYRGLADLNNCLRSIAVHRATEPSLEVILVDDCPAEPVLWDIPSSGGLIKIANRENLGFLLTCNRGAEVARGRILCFLNSDTIVSAGWLRSLVEALDEIPSAALVGGMLLNNDGTIQDAGWRILGNGWGQSIGRGSHPRDGGYTYRRPVDCVTGACFVVPRRAWNELGGLDPHYAPAFYEEFDFAFRARMRGLRVIYEPRSRVLHLGSASYGAERRDQLSGINHAKFCERFAEALRKQPWDTEDEFALRQTSGEGPVLLVVDHGVPQPDRHAGDVTISRYLAMLMTAGWRVVFGPMDGLADGPAAEVLERQGIELIRAPCTIEGWLVKHGRHVREVWLARPEITEKLIGSVRAHTSAHVAYYTHDLHHVRLEREAELLLDPAVRAEAARVRRQECAVFQNVDRVTTPSEDEAEVIRRLAPATPVTVVPPFYYEAAEIRTRDAAHFAALSDVVFVGGFPHTPNVDAALFIANEVMPLVWRECPVARLVLVGYAPPVEVQALAGPRTIVTGQVSQVEPFLDGARVFLAAMRYGAGVKGKTVDALRLGVPVVATPVGAEGIGIDPGREAVVAEGAVALAEGVLQLFGDPEYCAALSTAGAELIRRRFSRAAARAAIDEVFQTPRCGICGSGELIVPPLEGNFREAFVCRNCYALGRAEALARVMLGRLAREGEGSLAELARRRPELHVHEFGFVGGVADTLRDQPWFTVSEYFDGVPLGTAGPGGVRCEDLSRLTFADESFDIVISQDVMEHVPDPVRGFLETARVLKPGGSHIFTILQHPHLERSVTRAKLGPNGVEHVLPPEYHGDPVRSEGALVFTDYGRDLSEVIVQAGLELIEHDLPVLGGTGHETLRILEAVKRAVPLPELTSDDARIMADLQDSQQAFEELIRGCYTDTLIEGDTAIDGGANFGMHTGPIAAIIGSRGRLHAFEPLPHAAAALDEAFGRLPQVTLHQKALGQEPVRAKFHHVVNDAALSSLLKRDLSFAYPDLEVDEIEVDVVPLDTLAEEPVRFIKLDLEGYDFLALRGGKRLLAVQRPVVAFEFGRKDAAIPAGYGADDFFDLFDEIGYAVLDLFGRPFGHAEFDLPWNAREMPHYLVAAPADRREEVATKLRRRAWTILMEAGHQPPG